MALLLYNFSWCFCFFEFDSGFYLGFFVEILLNLMIGTFQNFHRFLKLSGCVMQFLEVSFVQFDF